MIFPTLARWRWAYFGSAMLKPAKSLIDYLLLFGKMNLWQYPHQLCVYVCVCVCGGGVICVFVCVQPHKGTVTELISTINYADIISFKFIQFHACVECFRTQN